MLLTWIEFRQFLKQPVKRQALIKRLIKRFEGICRFPRESTPSRVLISLTVKKIAFRKYWSDSALVPRKAPEGGARFRCGSRGRRYFMCRDKVTTVFQGSPAKTNEVLRQSGKSSARTAFLRLSSTWIRVAGLKLKKKQRAREEPREDLRGRYRLNVSRTNDFLRALRLISLFRFDGNKILTPL